VGTELRLTEFEGLFQQIKTKVMAGGEAPRVLPRDVPSSHPGAPFIEYVLTAGLLRGYPDATFHPSEPSTRYEFASALSVILDLVKQPGDVWRVLKDRGLGDVQVEVRVEPIPGRQPTQLIDVALDHWAQTALAKQAARGILQVDEEGLFRGQKLVTLRDAGAQWDLIAQSMRVVRTK